MLKKIDGSFYLDFTFRGKRYRVDTGRTRLRDAETFEANYRKKIADKWEEEQKELENKKISSKSKVTFDEAWKLFYNKKFEGENTKNINDIKAVLMDLKDFAKSKNYIYFDVPEEMLQEYMEIVSSYGTYHKMLNGKTQGNSNSSYNKKLTKIKFLYRVVCRLLKVENPTEGLESLESDAKDRDAFSLKQVETLKENCKEHFMYGVFFIGIHTGLRLGDIVHLRWKDIKTNELGIKYFDVTTRKTNTDLEIPFINGIEDYLNKLDHSSEYILPKHQDIYNNRKCQLSNLFQEMIKKYIPEEEIYEEREKGKKHCKLDIHSLRHTFAYVAAINGVPSIVVQRILGHTTAAMTNHYQQHTDIQLAHKELANMTFDLKGKVNHKDKLLELVCIIDKDNLGEIKKEMLEILKNM